MCHLSPTAWLAYILSLLSFLQFFHLTIVLVYPYYVCGQFICLYTLYSYNSPIFQRVIEILYKIVQLSCHLCSIAPYLTQFVLFLSFFFSNSFKQFSFVYIRCVDSLFIFHTRDSPIVQGVTEKQYKIFILSCVSSSQPCLAASRLVIFYSFFNILLS